jgi:hypothetical protein
VEKGRSEEFPNRSEQLLFYRRRLLKTSVAMTAVSLAPDVTPTERRKHPLSKPVEDLPGFDDTLDEPLRTTLKDFQRPSPWRKPEEEDELVERGDLRLGITSYPDHEVSERQANYDLSTENKKSRRSSRGFARYLVAILIGVTTALAWQSYGDVAKQMMANIAKLPELLARR